MSSYGDPSTSTPEDTHDHHSGTTIGIPQLAACLLLGYLFFRWYNSSSSNSSSSSTNFSRSPSGPGHRITAADLARHERRAEVVHGMFPQVSMTAIKWELFKNGGSVEITTEKILSEGGLREPPTPPPPAQASSSTTTPRRTPQPSTTSASASTPKSLHTDLISRYNLSSRLTSETPSEVTSPENPTSETAPRGGKSTSWSTNKSERQALLQKRRDEMILKARRRLEEQDAKRQQKATAERGEGNE